MNQSECVGRQNPRLKGIELLIMSAVLASFESAFS
jgi:hypothetical protein